MLDPNRNERINVAKHRAFRADAQTGLRREQYKHGIYWTGGADAFAAAGLCERERLPGQPGINKWCWREVGPEGRRFGVKRTGKDQYELYMSNEEVLARSSAEAREFTRSLIEPVDVEDVAAHRWWNALKPADRSYFHTSFGKLQAGWVERADAEGEARRARGIA